MTRPEPQSRQDRRDVVLEQALGNLLRAGVLTAAMIVLVGASLYLWRHSAAPVPNYRHFAPPARSLRTLGGILDGTLRHSGRAWIQFGLLVLIMTPVLRVAASLVGFALERDKLYVAITTLVLAILIYSMAGGHGL